MDGDVTMSFAVDENEPTASGRSGKLIIVPRTCSGRSSRDYGGDSDFDCVAVAKDSRSRAHIIIFVINLILYYASHECTRTLFFSHQLKYNVIELNYSPL